MGIKCHFCNSDTASSDTSDYLCEVCGFVYLDAETLQGEKLTTEQKSIIRICIRNEHEKRSRKRLAKALTLHDLHQFLIQYSPLDPLSKMDNALLNIEKASDFVGKQITIMYGRDYPYYHCFNAIELRQVLSLLNQEGFINVPDNANPWKELSISSKGYQRLRDIKRQGKDSRQCFVAMWLSPEMDNIYEKAIKPAIEYKEEGETEPRFHAIKIDNVHHLNDINDEIIAQIRRSRFMVCDLTGYRGGVYFEAGFAKGLGLEVIYTCRKDWVEPSGLFLKDKKGKQIKVLYDSEGNAISIKKEGIHFDLNHVIHIKWEQDKLDDFERELENSIKANIH